MADRPSALRIAAHVLDLISLSLFAVGTGLKGEEGALLIAAAAAAFFAACRLFDGAQINSPA